MFDFCPEQSVLFDYFSLWQTDFRLTESDRHLHMLEVTRSMKHGKHLLTVQGNYWYLIQRFLLEPNVQDAAEMASEQSEEHIAFKSLLGISNKLVTPQDYLVDCRIDFFERPMKQAIRLGV